MPTPFNEAILEGLPQTFEEFVRRDLKTGYPLPEEHVPSDHHKKELARAQERLAALEQLDDEAWSRRAAATYKRAVQEREAYLREVAGKRARVEARMAEVEAWRPPSPDHVSHKDGMLGHLKLALEDDCDASLLPQPTRRTGQELKRQELADIQRSIDYHAANYRYEVEETARRTAWAELLRESLSPSGSEQAK